MLKTRTHGLLCVLLTLLMLLCMSAAVHAEDENIVGWVDDTAYTVEGTETTTEAMARMWLAAGKGSTVKLNQDWVSNDSYKFYNSDKDHSPGGFDQGRITAYGEITIDLNGHKIDRRLTSAKKNGQVIRVVAVGTLTIKDTSEAGDGQITGGYNTGNGGGIYTSGDLIIENGIICGNTAASGGGIYSYTNTFVNGGQYKI